MSEEATRKPTFRHYFVDEAGDPNLFKKRGKPIVGIDGCSKFFMLYERSEVRFIRLVWEQAGLVYDVDDTRAKPCGMFYTRVKPLTSVTAHKKSQQI